MSGYKLYYFNVRGRGELVRLTFAATNMEFEDIRLTMEEWSVEKATGRSPFGQMPFIITPDGKALGQSLAIMKYICVEAGLTPPTNFGKAQADMIADSCIDFGQKATPSRFEKDEVKKAQLEEEEKAFTPGFLKCFEDLLRANNGENGYFVGDKLTYADISVFNVLNYVWFDSGDPLCIPEELKEFPLLAGHYERIMNIPAIKKWLEERPVTQI